MPGHNKGSKVEEVSFVSLIPYPVDYLGPI